MPYHTAAATATAAAAHCAHCRCDAGRRGRYRRGAALLLLQRMLRLVGRLNGGGQIEEALLLDALARAHVRDVIEVCRGGDELGPAIGATVRKRGSKWVL